MFVISDRAEETDPSLYLLLFFLFHCIRGIRGIRGGRSVSVDISNYCITKRLDSADSLSSS
jgi:hypothetical protein